MIRLAIYDRIAIAGREETLKRIEFFMTYGDGVSDVNISELLEFHKTQGH